ncbi:hypothetical protein [Streptomyces profundus]|uniref:hypothetical protein n=1 Tax=Streptomyces profundus TaxID=2867410 RepID=UPI001D15E8D8|nr:hypothetical protein [Streptomyces sp. MA3_2.13]UED85771.1 hypothetical protein K4G22_17530 [Streptomyces sp. MA3_2.13]
MTSHNGRDDEPREGVILPPGGAPSGEPRPAPTPAAPPAGQPWNQPWGPGQAGQERQPALPTPTQQVPRLPPSPEPPRPPRLPPGGGQHALPTQVTPVIPSVPPRVPPVDNEGATELIPQIETTTQLRAISPKDLRRAQPGPRGGRHGQAPPPPGQPAAPAPDEGATELIPLVTDRHPNEAATELIQPVPAAGPEDTTQLRPVPPRQPGRHRSPERSPEPTGGADETQALPAVDGEFGQLFRSAADREPPPPAWGGQPQGRHGGPPQGHGGPGARQYAGGPPGPERRGNPKVLIGAVIVGCALVGLIGGYLLSGDSGDGDAPGDPLSPEAQAEDQGGAEGEAAGGDTEKEESDAGGEEEADQGAAEAQAEALSALLADSNDSRDSVIESVANIRACQHLDRAADDLRAAADQRNGLVTRLNELTLDELPQGDELIQALTDAWHASAEADDHYAAWADEARDGDGNVCRGGQARHTAVAGEGDAASGRATEAKERAAALWNPLASQYGLPERAATQL